MKHEAASARLKKVRFSSTYLIWQVNRKHPSRLGKIWTQAMNHIQPLLAKEKEPQKRAISCALRYLENQLEVAESLQEKQRALMFFTQQYQKVFYPRWFTHYIDDATALAGLFFLGILLGGGVGLVAGAGSYSMIFLLAMSTGILLNGVGVLIANSFICQAPQQPSAMELALDKLTQQLAAVFLIEKEQPQLEGPFA